jgi:hypothetical protein
MILSVSLQQKPGRSMLATSRAAAIYSARYCCCCPCPPRWKLFLLSRHDKGVCVDITLAVGGSRGHRACLLAACHVGRRPPPPPPGHTDGGTATPCTQLTDLKTTRVALGQYLGSPSHQQTPPRGGQHRVWLWSKWLGCAVPVGCR